LNATPVSAILNSLGVHADGKDIGLWIPFDPGFAEGGDTPGSLLHETGHLLGLPDLYVSGAIGTFHNWDLMTGGGRWPTELFAWHRWKLGWIAEDQIVCIAEHGTRVVTLAPLGGAGGTKAVFVRRGRSVLAIEVRSKTGYDRTRCASGVLVYAVDQTHSNRPDPALRRAYGCSASGHQLWPEVERAVRHRPR
jgi:M6 family metalloprotease-like protein